MRDMYILSWIEDGVIHTRRYYSILKAKELFDELKSEMTRCKIRRIYISKILHR